MGCHLKNLLSRKSLTDLDASFCNTLNSGLNPFSLIYVKIYLNQLRIVVTSLPSIGLTNVALWNDYM